MPPISRAALSQMILGLSSSTMRRIVEALCSTTSSDFCLQCKQCILRTLSQTVTLLSTVPVVRIFWIKLFFFEQGHEKLQDRDFASKRCDVAWNGLAFLRGKPKSAKKQRAWPTSGVPRCPYFGKCHIGEVFAPDLSVSLQKENKPCSRFLLSGIAIAGIKTCSLVV